MRLTISHETRYHYEKPVPYALQQLRVTPKETAGQIIHNWSVDIKGGTIQTSFTDQHNNRIDLLRFDPNVQEISVKCTGEVETMDRAGVVGPHGGFAPIWLFNRATPLTKPGPLIRALAKSIDPDLDSIAKLHALNSATLEALKYEKGRTTPKTAAEDALKSGHGVCQDHAHIFISAARLLGFPSRYVAGFLMMENTNDQEAGHAWAEAFVEGIGWIGFDPPNDQCPDERYVRVATALDARGASPVSGLLRGEIEEKLVVSLQVQQ